MSIVDTAKIYNQMAKRTLLTLPEQMQTCDAVLEQANYEKALMLSLEAGKIFDKITMPLVNSTILYKYKNKQFLRLLIAQRIDILYKQKGINKSKAEILIKAQRIAQRYKILKSAGAVLNSINDNDL